MDSNTGPDDVIRLPGKPVLVGSTGRVMRAIVAHCQAHGGTAPTQRELMQATGLSSTSVVTYHVKRLARAGLLTLSGPTARSLTVPGATWTPPERLMRQLELAALAEKVAA